MKKYFVLLSVLAVGIASCTKEDDTNPEPIVTKPIITLDSSNVAILTDTVCGHLEDNVLHIGAGDTLKMYYTIVGEAPLSEYKLGSHANFDCHAHGEMQREDGDANAWHVHDIKEITGDVKSYTFMVSHAISDSASLGLYHYNASAVDQLGNEAEELEFNVLIK